VVRRRRLGRSRSVSRRSCEGALSHRTAVVKPSGELSPGCECNRAGRAHSSLVATRLKLANGLRRRSKLVTAPLTCGFAIASDSARFARQRPAGTLVATALSAILLRIRRLGTRVPPSALNKSSTGLIEVDRG